MQICLLLSVSLFGISYMKYSTKFTPVKKPQDSEADKKGEKKIAFQEAYKSSHTLSVKCSNYMYWTQYFSWDFTDHLQNNWGLRNCGCVESTVFALVILVAQFPRLSKHPETGSEK